MSRTKIPENIKAKRLSELSASEPRQQTQIRHRGVGLVKLAHALVEDSDEFGQTIRNRGVGGVISGVLALAGKPLLGLEDRLLENRDLRLLFGIVAAAHHHRGGFFRIEYPARQQEIGRLDNFGKIVERRAILVVRIEQDHMAGGMFK